MDVAQQPMPETARAETEAPDPDQDTPQLAEQLERLGIYDPLPAIRAEAEIKDNRGEVNLLKVMVTEALKLWKLEPDFLAEVGETFAEPGESFASAFSALRGGQRIVVLRSKPHSGTRTAALAMIDRLAREEHVRPHYLHTSEPTRLPTAALAAKTDRAYLMNLREHGEELDLSPKFALELRALSEILESAGSYLIVLIEAVQCARIDMYGSRNLVYELPAPDPKLVVSKRLKNLPDQDLANWLADPQIARLVDDANPRRAVEIAERIREAAATAFKPPLSATNLNLSEDIENLDFKVRVGNVVAVLEKWRPQLLHWHTEEGRTAFERNFLLATAVLHEFTVGAAYKEAKRLCTQFNDDITHLSGHSGPGVIELLNTIGADTDHEGSVRFARPRWDEAVLDYYWRDRPDLHDEFIKWLIHLPQSDAFPLEDPATVAERVLKVVFDLIMTPERVGKLETVIDLWSAQEKSKAVAWDLLDAASLHSQLGRDVAQTMLRWATAQDVPRRIAVAEVCGRDFGRLNTSKALVRLRHLIESGEAEVVDAAERALVSLWEEPESGRELLEQLTKWASPDKAQSLRAAARHIFAMVAVLPSPTYSSRPELLVRAVANEEDLNLVAKGWRHLLDSEMESDLVANALRPWFAAAVEDQGAEADVLSVLDRATTDGPWPRRRLVRCLDRWCGSVMAREDSPAGLFARKVEQFAEHDPADDATTAAGGTDSFA